MKRETVPTSPQYEGPDKPSSKAPLIKYKIGVFELLFILLVSFIGGMCGSLIINSYPADWPYADKLAIKDSNNKEVVYVGKQKNGEQILLADAFAKVKSSVVSFYIKKSNDDYQAGDFLGSGLVLTSDGWLISAIPDLKLKTNLVAITNDKKIYSIVKVIYDDYSQTTFLKCEGANLMPAQFANTENIDVGDETYAVFNSLFSGLRSDKAIVENINFHEEKEFNTQMYPYNFLITAGLRTEYLGAPLINDSGEVLGFNLLDNRVLPQQYFTDIMPMLISRQEVNRPALNFDYIDLDNQFGNQEQKGAKIITMNTLNSGLFVNDIVLKVDGEEITKTSNLTHVLQAYRPDNSAVFTIKRFEKEQEINVIL